MKNPNPVGTPSSFFSSLGRSCSLLSEFSSFMNEIKKMSIIGNIKTCTRLFCTRNDGVLIIMVEGRSYLLCMWCYCYDVAAASIQSVP